MDKLKKQHERKSSEDKSVPSSSDDLDDENKEMFVEDSALELGPAAVGRTTREVSIVLVLIFIHFYFCITYTVIE